MIINCDCASSHVTHGIYRVYTWNSGNSRAGLHGKGLHTTKHYYRASQETNLKHE